MQPRVVQRSYLKNDGSGQRQSWKRVFTHVPHLVENDDLVNKVLVICSSEDV